MKHLELLNKINYTESVDLCSNLIRFRTVNPPGSELEIVEYISDILHRAGISCEIVNHSLGRASLIARLESTKEEPSIVFCGHLDVVPEGEEKWLYDPYSGKYVDGKIWGRGSSDMKSGIAAMILAAKSLALNNIELKGDLILAFTADEEVDQFGAKELVKSLDKAPVQAIVIPEPSNNRVFIAEKGQLWLEVTTYGMAAHGSMPYLGKNAITMMMMFLDELLKLKIPYNEHPLLGGFTNNIGTIQGGMRTNIVPDRCIVTLDQRTVPGQDSNQIIGQINRLIEDLSTHQPSFSASLRVITDLCPIETDPQTPFVQGFCNVVNAITGISSIPEGVPYTTDAAILVPPLKSAMVICGPGNPNLAHQPNEFVELEKLLNSVKILTLTAAELLT